MGELVTIKVSTAHERWSSERHPWRRLAVIGDSLNLGARGSTASQVRNTHVDEDLQFAPDLVFVCAGANDALARSYEPAALTDELNRIIGALAEGGALG